MFKPENAPSLKAYRLIYLPTDLFKNSACLLRCIYVFCMDLRTNSNF